MIIFTNGVFDILHAGHVNLLKYCRELAGATGCVIAALNTDESVKRLKGQARPIFALKDRITVIESIKFVDKVLIFDEDTPIKLIKDIKPDIIVKGGDYRQEDVVGHEFCEVKIFNTVSGLSTTKAIEDLSHR